MEDQDVYSYIKEQETAWKTTRVYLTGSKDWNMFEHIERCTNVANGWFHTGKNDGLRPYNDIVTPIVNVAFRSEGFDAKDIVPFVNNRAKYFYSFIIKKYAPQWNRKVELDTIIDDIVETSVIYDLALVKNYKNELPEVIDLRTIAFCDQTDVLAGALCLRNELSVAEMLEYKGKWDDEKIDLAISAAKEERKNPLAGETVTKTTSKNIEVYELRGNLPEHWYKEGGDPKKYVPQLHIVCFYTDTKGEKNGITLYKGKDKKLTDTFKALKIDRIRSKGRACGKSIVESLFDEQTWTNYSGIKLKKMLDSAVNLLITDSEELAGQKLDTLKDNTILKQEKGATTTRLDGTLQNIQHFNAYQQNMETRARIKGSASEAQLGTNPVSGTPFALQNLVVQQGQGIHEYRQGKIATFFADQLYRDWILKMMVDDLNQGKKFSEVLTLDELQEISDIIATNQTEKELIELVLSGEVVTQELKDQIKAMKKEEFMKNNSKRAFFEVIKGELTEIPTDVMVNVAGKQRNMAQNADKITNIIREIIRSPQAFQQIPGIGKALNELLEESGMSPIDFTEITRAPLQPQQEQPAPTGA